MPDPADRLLPCSPMPLGAASDGRGTHFSVFSEAAEKVELCLFDATGHRETARLELPDCTDGIWHGYLPGAGPGLVYGYRAWGPYDPKNGLRFNGNKLLLDPYARQLQGDIKWHDALHGYRVGSPKGDLSFDRRDSAPYMPKAVITHDRFDWQGDRAPRTAWSDTVIYEMHVKGFTQQRKDLPEHDRGTFGALGQPSTIEYFKSLGITAVEFLPVHAFARDRNLLEKKLTNYWGYNTLAFFAPDRAYLSDGTIGQMKWAIRELHRAGIEVILDVVYNHTCEGSELGTTMSWRGFGNAEYYRLMPDDPRHHLNDTGTGNTINMTHPRVIQMVMDSLRYWVEEFHVDGFRFDLGVTLGREVTGFDPGCGFFDALMQDPVLNRVKLISEPWDIGMGGYQIGNHPAGMAEWNGKFRDDVRRYWKGDAGLRPTMAARLQGSAELFDHHRRRPWASVNFITAHDGFTLQDLVSYNEKHNEANGEDGKDGGNDNESNNWGAEGPTDNVDILTQRAKIQRDFLATLLLSHGTPMLLAGDEFGQTQQGNNNVYCHDDPLSWIDWSLPFAERGKALREFTVRLLKLRREHPVLQGRYFQHAQIEFAPGLKDVFWFDERGIELTPEDWTNPNGRLLGLRRVAQFDDGSLDVMIVLFNADGAEHEFAIPPPVLVWTVLLDTHDPAINGLAVPANQYMLRGHSVVLLNARLRPEEIVPPAADAVAAAGAEVAEPETAANDDTEAVAA